MHKFDTKVQYLKYRVLREVARLAWEDSLMENILSIPKNIVPGNTPTMRCCVYKERAILSERVHLAMGQNINSSRIIEVIEIACDECPAAGYEVTDTCRGCLAHRCEGVCKRGAISYDHNHVAHIDKSKCIECGRCATVCPYGAIINRKRPCQRACKVKAITIKENNAASINYDKCIDCGSCVYQCPFGAITDKSSILRVIEYLKDPRQKVYAMVAPSIASQYTYAKPGQIISGLKALGFQGVVEAALGADMVAWAEAQELADKGFLTSSCCPAFVRYIETTYPELKEYISHNLSPMATLAKKIKEAEPSARVVFIGPCTAKKAEILKESVSEYVDTVITFEELQALIDSRELDITAMEETPLEDASRYGRTFARSGGLTAAVSQALKEQGSDFEFCPITCDGIEECRTALFRKSKGLLRENFIEGMACKDGCVGGAGCLTHRENNKAQVDKHGELALDQTISGALEKMKSL